MVLAVANLLAALAVPDNVPIKFVEVTFVNPAIEVFVAPKDNEVDPKVVALYCN